MKKILLITLDFPPARGGIAVYLKNICRNLTGKHITVLAPKTRIRNIDFNDKNESYPIYRRRLLLPSFFWPRWIIAFWHTMRVLKQTESEIMLTANILPLGYILFMLSKFKKIPYWINLHGLDIRLALTNKWKKYWLMKILQNSQKIIVNSFFTKQQVSELEITDKEKIIILYPCPDNPELVNKETLEEYRYKYALDGKLIILTVGRLVKRKGINLVIQNMPKIIGRLPNAVYVIAGDGQERENIKKLIVNLKLQNSIRLLGEITDSEKAVLYQLANLFILTPLPDENDVEGFGIVYLEAASYGLPSIGSYTGGIGEAVIQGQTGILINPQNQIAMKEAIIKLLIDKNFAQNLGQKARQRVKEEFIWQNQVNKIKFF
jgi:phosphatidylinositol alpha-1,6-mannosyltransferase